MSDEETQEHAMDIDAEKIAKLTDHLKQGLDPQEIAKVQRKTDEVRKVANSVGAENFDSVIKLLGRRFPDVHRQVLVHAYCLELLQNSFFGLAKCIGLEPTQHSNQMMALLVEMEFRLKQLAVEQIDRQQAADALAGQTK